MNSPVKKIALLVLVFSFSSLHGQVVINEVFHDAVGTDTGEEWIELYNPTAGAINMNGYELVARSSGGDYTFNSFTLPANSFVAIYWNKDGIDSATELFTGATGYSNISDSQGSVSLYTSATHSSGTIIDYCQWGAGDQTFENSAVSAGIWTEDDFVVKVAPGHSMEYDGSGNSSGDWFDQSNPTPNNDNSLPVELSSFSANYTDGYVLVNWKTQSEINNSGFYVLRSEKEKGSYQKICPLIAGAGTSSDSHNYNFKDERVGPGKTFFYKLEQVDMDGTIDTFGPLEVTIQSDIKSRLHIPAKTRLVSNYPNPFNPGTIIYFTVSDENAFVSMAIYDLLGRNVRNLTEAIYPVGGHEISWSGTDDFGHVLSSGHYFCKMSSDKGKVSIIKLLKMQ
jgi:hypothetical protein